MEKKLEFRINVGGSSIILIIVVFALAVFAVLSIKASNSDLVLAKKTRTAVSEYYQADSTAETYLAEIDQLLQSEKTSETLKKALKTLSFQPVLESESASEGNISYNVKINDTATLEVVLTYKLDSINAPFYDVTVWKVNQEDVGDYDFDNFQFWDGTIDEE